MNKVIRNVIVVISAIIGFIAVTVIVMKFLGFDIDIENACPVCKKQPASKPANRYAEPTRIRRHYTEIKLPD